MRGSDWQAFRLRWVERKPDDVADDLEPVAIARCDI